MSARAAHRHLLLSTTTPLGALSGYARSAAFAATIIAGAAILATPARSQDATWLPNADDGNFSGTPNWNTGIVPTGTAFFGVSVENSLFFPVNTTIGGWTFNAGADDYDFSTLAGRDFNSLTFDGAGIVINGGSATIFNSAGILSNLRFFNNSTAGNATINNANSGFVTFFHDSTAGSATIINDGSVWFQDNSTAGSATITNKSGGNTSFNDNSTAGSSTITNSLGLSSNTSFNDNSTAGSATIINISGSINFNQSSTAGNATITKNSRSINFNDNSTAGSATITSEGFVKFFNNSTAGSATITNINAGITQFFNNSTAGSATITTGRIQFFNNSTAGKATIINNAIGSDGLTFRDSSTAGSATITNNKNIKFNDQSTAGSATITNNAFLNFNNSSTAGSATITNINAGITQFFNNSTAGSATITNNAFLNFNNSSTAGNANITNNGALTFITNSTAGSATITNGNLMGFSENSTAGNANITNSSNLVFFQTSTAGNAAITNNAASAIVDFSPSSGPAGDNKLSAGSLAGMGNFFLGANQLTVGGNNHSTEVTGVISSCGPTGTECFATGATGGSLVKVGSGAMTLSGANIYTGPTWVNGGALIVNGSIVSPVTVNKGGTLGGTGSVGATTVSSGGVLAPGNSIGTMRVNGNFTLKSGATYEVEANAQGQADKVVVKGAVNLTGATLRVLEASGAYSPKTNYKIIDNDGTDAVKGKFAKVTNNLAFLIPTVDYKGGSGNDVVLMLERNSTLFQDLARTRNQKAVAGALDQFPTDNPLFLAVLNQTAAGARQAFDALSGEVHATVAGTLSDDSRYVREAVLGRLKQASHSGEALSAGGPQVASLDTQAYALGYDGKSLIEPEPAPLAFWTRAFGAWGDFDTDGNAASADRDLGGFISGMDADIGSGWRAGLATGASFSNVDVDARYSSANVETYHLGGYIGGMASSFALRGGGMWAWSDIDTSRAVMFPGFYERQKASYDADTGQLFGEIAYPTQMGGVALEPFGGLAFVSVDTDNFRERGGAQASLRGVNVDQDVGYTSLGLRAATTMMWGATQVTPHISAAWLHAFDDVTPGASLAFATTGIGFSVAGVPLAEDSAVLDAGLDFALGERMTAGVSYTGQYSDSVTDNGVKGRFTWLF